MNPQGAAEGVVVDTAEGEVLELGPTSTGGGIRL